MNTLVSAIIPAAGNSIRMGKHKALLRHYNHMSFAGHLINIYRQSGCSPVVVVVNEEVESDIFQTDGAVVVINKEVAMGRSHSIRLGSYQIQEGCHCFIHNVDNPFLELLLIEKLRDAITPDRYAVPVYNGKAGHPVLLGSLIVDDIRRRPSHMDFKEVLSSFQRIEVTFPDERIFWNINTPDDYMEFLRTTMPNR